MIRRAAISLVALAAAGCTWGDAPGFSVAAVEPKTVANDLPAVVVVSGDGFVPAVTVDFDDPARSGLSLDYRVELRRDRLVVPLSDVTVLSAAELRGRIPADTSRGAWDVAVIAPGGDSRLLSGALKVTGTTCVEANGDCDDRNSCTAPDTCQGFTCQSGPALPDGEPCELFCLDRTIVGTCAAGACDTGGVGC